MRSFVKTTEMYDETAKTFGCSHVIERFQARVLEGGDERTDPLKHLDQDYGYIRTNRNKLAYFTCRDKIINGILARCYLALAVFKYDSEENRNLWAVRGDSSNKAKILGLDRVDWDKIWKDIELELKKRPALSPLEELTQEERSFIQRDKSYVEQVFDVPIYETKQWIDKVRSKDFGDPFKVGKALEDYILDIEINDESREIRGQEIQYDRDSDNKPKCVLCWRLKRPEHDGGTKEGKSSFGWFLLGLGLKEELEQVKKELRDVLASDDKGVENDKYEKTTYQMLAKECRRDYPLDMLADKDRWSEMEDDRKSNFILSDQEIDIVSSKLEYPLFITGRAGSGKSTMLQYLLADYFLRFIETNIEYPPIYISYSKQLSDAARDLTQTLFEKNHAFTKALVSIGGKYSDDIEPRLDKSFKIFGELVREHVEKVNKAVANERFKIANHVSFQDFRTMWLDHFGKTPNAARDYGPELSWHVIRSYIKGWDSESYCEPEDYANSSFGKKNKSVSDEVYRKVFDIVWKWYRELQESEGYWDDQDLVRYCLSPDDDSAATCVTPQYSAVFCDESQDFTRVETEFIIRLSVFSNRNIDGYVPLLPFVFAGDEFQTLNPTGFSWDSLRSYFTERLCSMTRCRKTVRAPEPKNLVQNYRSTVPVVKFANRIQLLRLSRCGAGEGRVDPQTPYYAEAERESVFCLNARDAAVWQQLRRLGVSVIIPSTDGEKVREFFDRSPVKGMVEFYDNGAPKGLTVYNPVQAKGLEYPTVALYGFDLPDVLPKELTFEELLKWFDKRSGMDEDSPREITLKYFLSSAYVAATRAEKKLFILLDGSAEKSFWSFALASGSSAFQKKVDILKGRMLDRIKKDSMWHEENMLGCVVSGAVGDLSNVGFVPAREAAEKALSQGLELHDPDILRQAGARFNEQNDNSGFAKCEGWAHYYERAYRQAAELFLEAGEVDLAIDAYWHDCRVDNAETIAALAKLREQKFDSLPVRIAVEMQKHPIPVSGVLGILGAILSCLNQSADNADRRLMVQTSSILQKMIDAFLEKLPSVGEDDMEQVRSSLDKLDEIEVKGVRTSHNIRARLSCSIRNYERAIKLWEQGLSPNELVHKSDYCLAKALTEPYPGNLAFWERSQRKDWRQMVIRDYRRDTSKEFNEKLSEANKSVVAEAFFRDGTPEEAQAWFPFLLAKCATRDAGISLLKEAMERRGVKCSRLAMEAILNFKFGTRVPDSIFGHRYSKNDSQEARGFDVALRRADSVRQPRFMSELNDALARRVRVVDFMQERFGIFARKRWSSLLFVEIGRAMESRKYFVDAARYYEWARQQIDDAWFQRKMDIRWIVCKERQGEHTETGTEARREAEDKRRELNIRADEILPMELALTVEEWNWFFERIITFIPMDSVGQNRSKERFGGSALEEKKEVYDGAMRRVPRGEATSSRIGEMSQPVEAKSDLVPEGREVIQSISKEGVTSSIVEAKPASGAGSGQEIILGINGYKLKYKPNRQLAITRQEGDEEEGLLVRFKHPEYAGSPDFHLVANRLVITERNEETPFEVVFHDSCIEIIVVEAQVVMTFPLPPKVR